MRFLILFSTIIRGGVLFSCVYLKKRFEQALPAAVLSRVLMLYLFAIFGFLKSGAYFVATVYLAAYPISLYKIIKDKSFKETLKNFCTPVTVLFAALAVFYAIGLLGMMPSGWDEFSHWASCVKLMHINNALYTAPEFGAGFQSYPPAMALLQYFGQFLAGKWRDWYMYWIYAVFSLSMMVPFLHNIELKKPLKAVTAISRVAFALIYLMPNRFTSLYIDAFLSIIAAFCMAYTFCFDCVNDGFHRMVFSMGLAVLALTKDAGMLFAVFALAGYMLAYFKQEKSWNKNVYAIACLFTPALFLTAAKLSWKAHLGMVGSRIRFDGKYNLVEFIKILLGRDMGYKSETVKNFINNFFKSPVTEYKFYTTGYSAFFAAVIMVAVMVVCISEKFPRYKNKAKTVISINVFGVFVYVMGLLPSYIYKFVESEAVGLASFDRYISTAVCAVGLFLVFAAVQIFIHSDSNGVWMCFASVYMVMSILLNGYGHDMLGRVYLQQKINSIGHYVDIANYVKENSREDDVFVNIGAVDSGYIRGVMSYYVMPVKTEKQIPFSITSQRQAYDGDVWSTTDYTEKKLLEDLKKYNITWVFVASGEERFYNEYAGLFAERPVKPIALYRFDEERGKLVFEK